MCVQCQLSIEHISQILQIHAYTAEAGEVSAAAAGHSGCYSAELSTMQQSHGSASTDLNRGVIDAMLAPGEL